MRDEDVAMIEDRKATLLRTLAQRHLLEAGRVRRYLGSRLMVRLSFNSAGTQRLNDVAARAPCSVVQCAGTVAARQEHRFLVGMLKVEPSSSDC